MERGTGWKDSSVAGGVRSPVRRKKKLTSCAKENSPRRSKRKELAPRIVQEGPGTRAKRPRTGRWCDKEEWDLILVGNRGARIERSRSALLYLRPRKTS